MSAIPPELLGLSVEVVRSNRRSAALHLHGTALQVRVPLHLPADREPALLQQNAPGSSPRWPNFSDSPPAPQGSW